MCCSEVEKSRLKHAIMSLVISLCYHMGDIELVFVQVVTWKKKHQKTIKRSIGHVAQLRNISHNKQAYAIFRKSKRSL